MIDQPDPIIARLRSFQRDVRDLVVRSRSTRKHGVSRAAAADTIYEIDAAVEPLVESFFERWAREAGHPIIVVSEGMEDEHGRESGWRVFPVGAKESDAPLRVIVDPIDGTRGIMYDKRPAWALAGVAPNRGDATRLRDVEVAVMTELPTSKMSRADVLFAVKGRGARMERESVDGGAAAEEIPVSPSTADDIRHGFAAVSNFFPGTKVLASELMEHLVRELIGPADVTKAMVFDDQYISTGGQFYELIVGHDRFVADLRPLFYAAQGQPPGLCCHPYDCAAALVATEAGVVLTDGTGNPLDGPFDTTTGISWAGFANETLRRRIEPLLTEFLCARGAAR